MNYRKIAFGVIGLLFTGVICIAFIVIIGAIGGVGFSGETTSRLTRITLLPSLAMSTAISPETVNAPLPAKPNIAIAPQGQQASSPPATVIASTAVVPENAAPSHFAAKELSRLVIPKLGLDASVILSPMVAESWQVDHLGQAVGYLEGTAFPGSSSNLVLAAHVTLASGVDGPFSQLNHLSADDPIWVHYQGQIFQYMVDDAQVVDPTTIAVTYPSKQGQITLITCNQWDEAQGRYQDRLVVKGHLVGG